MAERPTADQMSPVLRASLARGLTTRRALMTGAFGLGATAALSACGSEGTSGTTSGSATPTAAAAKDMSDTEKVINWSNWTQYIDVSEDESSRPTLDEFHDQEDGAGVLALVGDVHDRGGGQPGRGLGLAAEPGDEFVIGRQRRVHHLDGDRTVEAGVDRGVDRCHTADGEAPSDLVPVVEKPPEQRIRDGRGHEGSLGATA